MHRSRHRRSIATALLPTAAPRSEMNVTPLVDVVLVLLIIFMILTPILQTGYYDLKVPPQRPEPPAPAPVPLVVSLTADHRIFLNREEVLPDALGARLKEILEGHAERTVFFSGDDEADFDRAVAVMDIMRNSGAKSIGIVLETVPVD